MKGIAQTDIFARVKDTYKIPEHVKAVVNGAGTRITTELSPIIASMQRSYKDISTQKALQALGAGQIILIYGKEGNLLPPEMPFLKTKKEGKEVVICDLTYTTFDIRRDRKTGETTYFMEMRQLNSILIGAYYALNIHEDTILPHQAVVYMSAAWARMFLKVLNKAVFLNQSPERYKAFHYLATMYFLINMLDYKPAHAEQIAVSQFKDGKNGMLRNIEEEITRRGLNPYASFADFCNVLFNKEITGLGGSISTSKDMNTTSYIRAFINIYDRKSLFALAAFPYYFFLYVSVNNANRAYNIRVFEDVMVSPGQYATVMSEMSKMF